MQRIATGALGLMAVLFIASSLAAHRWPAAAYVRAFAEAAMVGGCADWFAVTALFRRPLGLPIPHTGVIPRNQARIADALGGFIADNFLTEAVLDTRLHQLEVAAWGATWARAPGHARALAASVLAGARQLASALPEGAARQTLSSMSVATLKTLPAHIIAARLLELLWDSDRAERLISLGLKATSGFLAARQDLVLDQVQAQSYKWMPTWVDRIIARRIVSGLIQLMADAEAADHPVRIALDRVVWETIERLSDDPELIARLDAAKLRLLSDADIAAALDQVWTVLAHRLDALLDPGDDTARQVLERTILLWADWLDDAREVQAIFNTTARALLRGAVAPRRHDIGRFVADIVAGWDTASMVGKLEVQLGADLQYIRINGAVVGGLVGLAIYAAAKLTGLG